MKTLCYRCIPTAALTCLLAGFAAATSAEAAPTLHSYTAAYREAGDAHKPMLVVLNGPNAAVDVDALSADAQLASAMGDYVVAEIDVETAHGKKVHELFKAPSLPHVVVIGDDQRKQLFKTSREMTAPELAAVLTEYKDGPPAAPQTVVANRPVTSTTTTPVVSASTPPAPAAGVAAPTVISAPAVQPAPVSLPTFSPGLPQAVPADCPACKLKAMGLR